LARGPLHSGLDGRTGRGVPRGESREDDVAIEGRRSKMADIVFLGVTVAFFALSWSFVEWCERL
jgi:hypothetical protein